MQICICAYTTVGLRIAKKVLKRECARHAWPCVCVTSIDTVTPVETQLRVPVGNGFNVRWVP
jgi:hypothetical protein